MSIQGAVAHLRQTVLVAEAEPVQRLQAVRLAESIGIAAIEARDVSQAVSLLRRRPDISIVFADADLPGQSRPGDLVRYIAARWPTLSIIVASGSNRADHLDLPSGHHFVTKPIYSKHLLAALNRRLPLP